MILLSEKVKLRNDQTIPLMFRKPEVLHVENPRGFFRGTAKGISVHCLGVLELRLGITRIGTDSDARKPLKSRKPVYAALWMVSMV